MKSYIRICFLSIVGFLVLLFIFQRQRMPKNCSQVTDHVRTVEVRYLETNVSNKHNVEDNKSGQTERVYKERVNYAMSQCHSHKIHKVADLIKHDKHKLAYCKVPKVGCTFWMRMLLYLYNDTGGTAVKSPFEIPRMFVHVGKKEHLKIRKDFPKIENQLTNYTRFMFTRDPFSRLWSAYLDKFRLPDFWRFFNAVSKRGSGVSEKSRKCRHDASFKEFLLYVLSQKPDSMNEHWQPISYHCDPCLFKPTVIGKVETFNDDARYVLGTIGFEGILSSFNSETYVEQELAMLTDYNFDLLNMRFYKDCLTERSVALLLWEVFQLNGYLPKEVDADDALRELNVINVSSFRNFVINYYRSASRDDKRRWKLQKATALKDAYSSIPKSLTDRLVSIYKEDFSMFGYDFKPPGHGDRVGTVKTP